MLVFVLQLLVLPRIVMCSCHSAVIVRGLRGHLEGRISGLHVEIRDGGV